MVEQEPLAGSDETEIHITISAGIASWNGKEVISINELIDRADHALYQSKETGRNKVTAWRQP